MHFKRRIQYEQGLKQLDIAPLINIIFLLLIFILLIVGFVGLPGIRVSLPGMFTSSAVKNQNLELFMDKEGVVFYKAKPLSNVELRNLLAQLPANRIGVLIKADKGASLTSVMQVWQVCREQGIQQVNIAATRE